MRERLTSCLGFLLDTPVANGFEAASVGVERLLAFTSDGAKFVFGPLAQNTPPFGYLFAFQVLPSELPDTTGELRAERPHESVNLLDALVRGTLDGVRLAVNVAAMLIVFLAMTAMFDALLGKVGVLFGLELSLTRVLSWLFAPLAFLLGVPLAGYSALAPERLGDLSRLGLRAMIGGLLTTCLVACTAGILL